MKIRKKRPQDNRPKYRVNDEIRNISIVRLTGDEFETNIYSLDEAKKIALEKGLDLIEIAPMASPPVLRMVNYEKFVYEYKKAQKKNKQQVKQLKEIQLRVNIAQHDLQTKAKNARKFLEEGNKVKVVLTMKGRELVRREENKKAILEFITSLDEVAVPESLPRDEGNRTTVILKKR